jgi:hypothetical protein
MAIITTGGGVASISGSVAGTTYSRNRGGPYMRNRAIPVNPNTTYQQAVRGHMAALTSHWVETLTADQRAAWDNYALQVPLPNALGQPRNVGGIGMYVRSNVPRLQTALPRVDDAPTIFDLGVLSSPGPFTVTAATGSGSLAYDDTDEWCDEDDSALLIYGSRGQSPSVNSFEGPYRYQQKVDGDSTTPPTSPETLSWVFPLSQGQRAYMRLRVTRADGRLSSSFRLGATAA